MQRRKSHSIPSRGFLAGIVLLSLACSGCLDMEKQTMLVVFPKDGKEIKALFVYQGLRVAGSGPKGKTNDQDLSRAKDDLAQLVRGETFYMGPDPLLRIYLKPGKHDKPNEWDTKAMKVLNKHVVPGKGVFVLGKNGELSFCQPITVRDLPPFLAWLNQIIGEGILEEIHPPKDKKTFPPPRGKEPKFDPFKDKETVRFLEQAVKDGFRFVRLESGRISFNFPGNPKIFNRLKRDLMEDIVGGLKEEMEKMLDKAGKDKVDAAKLREEFAKWESDAKFDMKMLADIPWSIEQRHDRISLLLGWGDNHPFRLPLDFSGKSAPRAGNKHLIAFARTLGAPVLNDVSIEDLLESFQRTQTLKSLRKEK